MVRNYCCGEAMRIRSYSGFLNVLLFIDILFRTVVMKFFIVFFVSSIWDFPATDTINSGVSFV